MEELIFRVNYVFTSRRVSKSQHMRKDTINRGIEKLLGIEHGRKKQPPNIMGNIEYFIVHDLRRTSRNLLTYPSVPPHVTERCLNHKLKGVEEIYDRYDYFDERNDALKLLAKSLPTAIQTPEKNKYAFNTIS